MIDDVERGEVVVSPLSAHRRCNVECLVDDVGPRPSDRRCLVGPSDDQVIDGGPSLLRSCVDSCLSGERGSLPLRRLTALALDEVIDLVVQRGLDLDGALGEQSQHVLRHTRDFGLAVLDRFPFEPEPVREFVAEHRLVDAAEHPLVLLHVGAVECEPTSVGGADLVGDHRVGVEVGIVGSRCRLPEGCNREAVGVGVESLVGSLSDASGRTESFEMCERGGHGGVVCVEESLVLGERPQDADRLRRGEGRVEAGDGAFDASVAHRAITERSSELCPRYGVTGFEEREQIVLRHVASEPELGGLVARPYSRYFARCLRQVVGVVLGRGCRSAGVDGGYAQHRTTRSRLGTCLNSSTATGGARHDTARDLRPTTAGRAGGRETALDEERGA